MSSNHSSKPPIIATNNRHDRYLKLATYASLITATMLIIAKFIAWMLTGSLSLLATLIDSGMDILASLITFIAIRIALAPPDEDHNFGHGKAEHLSALAQALFISGSAFVLALNAIDRLINPHNPIIHTYIGIYVMIFSILCTTILLSIQKFVIKKTQSIAIASDSAHYKMDTIINIAVLLVLVLVNNGYGHLDAIIALLISFYMLWSIKPIIKEAIETLMDEALPKIINEEIGKTVLNCPGVIGFHELRTRKLGQVPFIQLHLEIEASLHLEAAHRIGLCAKKAILQIEGLQHADITIHLDPV